MQSLLCFRLSCSTNSLVCVYYTVLGDGGHTHTCKIVAFLCENQNQKGRCKVYFAPPFCKELCYLCKIVLLRKQLFAILSGSDSASLFENPAEIVLIGVANHFANLSKGQ